MIKTKELPCVFLLALLWAPTFLFIRIGVESIHPLTFTTVRCLFASVALVIFTKLRGGKLRPYFKHTKKLLPTALFLNVIPFSLCAMGEQFVDSSTAAIIEGSVPLFTLLVSYFLYHQKDISMRQVLCICIGFVGLVITFTPTLSSMEITNVFGFFAIIFMAFFFALGFLYSEKHIKELPPTESTTIQMLFSSLTLLPLHFFFGEKLLLSKDIYPSLISACALGIGCTAFGWMFYFFLLKKGVSAKSISIATLVCPIFAIFLSFFILHEDLTIYKAIGTVVILSSVFFMSELSKGVVLPLKKKSISDSE